LYLRVLPAPIITKAYYSQCMAALELTDREQRFAALNVVISLLPRANRQLLKSLFAFLHHVVRRAEVNKMSASNLSIVFSPTLNLPGPLIITLLTEYNSIFSLNPTPDSEVSDTAATGSANSSPQPERPRPMSMLPRAEMHDSLPRNPRPQTLAILSSPSFEQTSTFSMGGGHHGMPMSARFPSETLSSMMTSKHAPSLSSCSTGDVGSAINSGGGSNGNNSGGNTGSGNKLSLPSGNNGRPATAHGGNSATAGSGNSSNSNSGHGHKGGLSASQSSTSATTPSAASSTVGLPTSPTSFLFVDSPFRKSGREKKRESSFLLGFGRNRHGHGHESDKSSVHGSGGGGDES